jgi:hypothetical protein
MNPKKELAEALLKVRELVSVAQDNAINADEELGFVSDEDGVLDQIKDATDDVNYYINELLDLIDSTIEDLDEEKE